MLVASRLQAEQQVYLYQTSLSTALSQLCYLTLPLSVQNICLTLFLSIEPHPQKVGLLQRQLTLHQEQQTHHGVEIAETEKFWRTFLPTDKKSKSARYASVCSDITRTYISGSYRRDKPSVLYVTKLTCVVVGTGLQLPSPMWARPMSLFCCHSCFLFVVVPAGFGALCLFAYFAVVSVSVNCFPFPFAHH